MPIRFRCVYCNQLLGISRRKAGTVVRCTSCEGQIIVPDEPVEAKASTRSDVGRSGTSNLFEQDNIDDVLRPMTSAGSSGRDGGLKGSGDPTAAPAFRSPDAAPPDRRPLFTGLGLGLAIGFAVGYGIARLAAG
jgi:DNA-directed RNA polymerase subunit RPC12/RpoP